MLALTRRVGETIVIGEGPDEVRMTIVEILGGHVRLGFDAPRHIQINRSEVVDEQEEDAK